MVQAHNPSGPGLIRDTRECGTDGKGGRVPSGANRSDKYVEAHEKDEEGGRCEPSGQQGVYHR